MNVTSKKSVRYLKMRLQYMYSVNTNQQSTEAIGCPNGILIVCIMLK